MILLGLLGVLLLNSVWANREALVFCEKALYGEVKALSDKDKMNKTISFTEVCPDLRARAENNLNKWLEVILALMVQFNHPSGQ
jgi:hypothetical protein